MDELTTRMALATAAVAAVAALLAGPAGATLAEGISGQAGTQSGNWRAQSSGDYVVPKAPNEQGIDVATQTAIANHAQQLGGVHAALMRSRDDVTTAPLPHGAQVVLSPSNALESIGLTGDSPLTRVVPDSTPAVSTPTVTTSSGTDFDWASFGAGAGMVALVAAGLLGALLATRRRRTVGLS